MMADTPKLMWPPEIGKPVGENQKLGVGIFGRSDDTAKYVIKRARFERPLLYIPIPSAKPGGADKMGPSFEWPGGVEGVRVSGQVGNARHKYIGDNAERVKVMHRDSRTLELSGQFAGVSGNESIQKLLSVITAVPPTGHWMLKMPANVLPARQWQVNIDSYDFTHAFDDRMDSWDYAITFIYVGTGPKLVGKKQTAKQPLNPVGTTIKVPKKKGKGARTFTIHSGARTLRAVAKLVYGNPERWPEIYNKNFKYLTMLNIPFNILPTKILPLGFPLKY